MSRCRCGHPVSTHSASRGRCLVLTCECEQFRVDLTRSARARASQRKGEAEEQEIKRILEAHGGIVYKLSEPGVPKGKHRRRGTMKTPGPGDFLVFFPSRNLGFFWDSKAGTARPSKPQREFMHLVNTCRIIAADWGDRVKLRQYLNELGLKGP